RIPSLFRLRGVSPMRVFITGGTGLIGVRLISVGVARSFPDERTPGGSVATPAGQLAHPKERLQRFFPEKCSQHPSRRGLSPAHKTLLLRSSPEIGRSGAPRMHGGRSSDRFVRRDEPHPEAHASRSRPIRSRIAANSWRGTATSANWKMTYLACVTTFA